MNECQLRKQKKEKQQAKIPTLNSARSISSTGVSLNCPFFAFPIAVRFAKVMTTSFGCFCRTLARLPDWLEAFRMIDGARRDMLNSLEFGMVMIALRHIGKQA
jgi:hypothetical protein